MVRESDDPVWAYWMRGSMAGLFYSIGAGCGTFGESEGGGRKMNLISREELKEKAGPGG